jgi:hypothetical protein
VHLEYTRLQWSQFKIISPQTDGTDAAAADGGHHPVETRGI